MPPSAIDAMGADDYYRLVRHYNAEPFGSPREEERMAQLTAAVYRSSSKTWKSKALENPSSWRYKQRKSIDVDEVAATWESMAGLRTKRRGD